MVYYRFTEKQKLEMDSLIKDMNYNTYSRCLSELLNSKVEFVDYTSERFELKFEREEDLTKLLMMLY